MSNHYAPKWRAFGALLFFVFAYLMFPAQAQGQIIENFDMGVPAGWSVSATGDDLAWSLNMGETPNSNTGPSADTYGIGSYFYLDSYGTTMTSGGVGTLVSAPYTLGTGSMAQFYYHLDGQMMGELDFEIKTVDGWTNIWAHRGDQGDMWHRADIDLSAYAGQTVQFRFVGELGGFTSDMAIDLFSVGANICNSPLHPEIIDITAFGGVLSFSENGSTNFDVLFDVAGFDPLTGGTTISSASSPVDLGILLEDTPYDVYVRANCGTSTSQWIGPIQFQTLLGCIDPEDFTAYEISDVEVMLDWTAFSGQVWNFSVTNVDLGTSYVLTGITDKPYNLQNLDPESDYIVLIEEDCSAGNLGTSGYHTSVTFTTLPPLLSGTYTIDGTQPTAGTNFNSFGDFQAALANGLKGAIVVNVVQGTYNEQLLLSDIPGSSSTNTITIQSHPSNTSAAILTYAATSSSTTSNYVILFQDAQYITIDGLELVATGTSYSRVVVFDNENTNLVVQNCTITGYTTTSSTTSTDYATVYNLSSTGNNTHNSSILNNTITGGTYGVYWYGGSSSSSNMENGNTFSGNTITDWKYSGIYCYYQADLTIKNNTLVQSTDYPYSSSCYGIYQRYIDGDLTNQGNSVSMGHTSSCYGIYFYYTNYNTSNGEVLVEKNTIDVHSTSTNYGLYMGYNYDGSVKVLNNFVTVGPPSSGSSSTYGYYQVYTYTDALVAFNTFVAQNSSSSYCRALYYNSSNSSITYTFLNNNFVNTGSSGYAAYYNSSYPEPDYNNYFSSSSNLAYWSGARADLAALQSANGMDANSVSGNPIFDPPGSGIPSSGHMNAAGTPISGVTTDITGASRSNPPDIGAFQFTPNPCEPPTNVMIGDVYDTKAYISWEDTVGIGDFVIEIGPAGFAPGTGTTLSGLTSPTKITALTANTSYDIYIARDCSGSSLGSSAFIGPFSFTTLNTFDTNSPISTYPNSEDFDSQSNCNSYSSCSTCNITGVWQNISGDNGDWNIPSSTYSYYMPTTDASGSGKFVCYYPTSSCVGGSYGGEGGFLESSTFDFDGISNPTLEFKYWLQGYEYNNGFRVLARTEHGVWEEIFTLRGNQGSNWMQGRIYMPFYSDSLVRFRFQALSGTSSGQLPCIDEISMLDGPSCLDPYNVIVTGLTSSSADLVWESFGTGTSWEISYGEAPYDPDDLTNTMTVSSMMATVSGLSAGTNYEFYIREVCSATESSFWTNAVAAQTAYEAPYLETFDSYLPTGWTEGKGAIDNPTVFTSSSSYWGEDGFGNIGYTGAAKINIYSTGRYEWLFSPAIYLPSSSSWQLVFDAAMTPYSSSSSSTLIGEDDTVHVVISTDGGLTWNRANVLWSVGGDNVADWPSNTGDLIAVSLQGYEGMTIMIGVYAESTLAPVYTDNDFFVDNFSIEELLTCPNPSDIMTSNATQSTVDVAWTQGDGGGGEWLVSVVPTGDSPNASTATSAYNTSVTVSGLTYETVYDVYVKEICSSTDESLWAGPTSFQTDCGPGSIKVLLEIYSGNYGNEMSWELYKSDDLSTVIASGGGYSSYSYYYQELCLEEGGTYSIKKMDSYGDGWNNGYVKFICSGSGATTALAELPSGSLAWEDLTLFCACPAPSGLMADNIDETSLDLNWDASYNASTYTIKYGLSGQTPSQTITGINGTMTTISGLTTNTAYDFTLQSDCGIDGSSSVTGPLTVNTACGTVAAPFYEDFDGSTWAVGSPTSSQFDPCWSREQTGQGWAVEDNGTVSSGTGPASDVTGGNYLYPETSSPYPAEASVISPRIDLTGLSFPYLTFWYHAYGSSSDANSSTTVDIIVDGTTYTNVWQNVGPNGNYWDSVSVNLADFVGETIQIVWRANYNYYTADWAIDQVEVIEGPPCSQPSAFTVDSIFGNQARLSWITGGSSDWNVVVGPPEFNLGTATVINTMDNPYWVTGLTAETTYWAYVRDNCGANGVSGWVGPVVFTTGICDPVLLHTADMPYEEDMEGQVEDLPCGWRQDNLNGGNAWAGLNRESVAQSDDASVAIEWNSSNMNDWVFTPLMKLDAYQSVDIEFSYRARSEFYNEALELWYVEGHDHSGAMDMVWSVENFNNNSYVTVRATGRADHAGYFSFGFHGVSNANEFAIYLDDVKIEETPCPAPYLVEVDNIDFFQADVSWMGDSSNYVVEWGPRGFEPGTGMTASVSGHNYTITGLHAAMMYDVYVYAACNDPEFGMSLYEGPTAFDTRCPEITDPYADLCVDWSTIALTGGIPAGSTEGATNGFYSGPGVSGGMFNPAAAGVGTHVITYNIPGIDACDQPTRTITVNPLPVVSWIPSGSVCVGVDPFPLTNGQPAGGVYSGPGVVNGTTFNPSLVGVGSYQILYTYTDGNGCDESVVGTVNVTPLPTVTLANQPALCGTEGGAFALTGGSPAGGWYEGTGVTDNVFDPAAAGVGNHNITYYYSQGPGCTQSATKVLKVSEVPTANAGADITMNWGTSSPLAGSATGGSGIYNFLWIPGDSVLNATSKNTSTKGLHVDQELIFRVTDNVSGCVDRDTLAIDIIGGPLKIVELEVTPTVICAGDSATLRVRADGGSQNYFFSWTPSTGAGSPLDSVTKVAPLQTTIYQILVWDGFNFIEDSIQVTVNPLPAVGMDFLPTLCEDNGPITLEQGSPSGGTYSGVGVSNGVFDPAVAGVGNHVITYTYTSPNTGCTAEFSRTLTVKELPTVSFPALADRCVNGANVLLNQATPAGGTYSGTGVVNGMFSPAAAGVGTHIITYHYMDADGCDAMATQTITVNDVPSVSLSQQSAVCVDGGAVDLTGGSPAGGVYSGSGVSNGAFDPSVTGAGTFNIAYTYTDGNGCSATANNTITVDPVPVVGLPAQGALCLTDVPMMLSGGSPAGGSYSGTGVSGGMFDPSVAGVGTHVITYSYTSSTGCENTATNVVVVNELPDVTVPIFSNVCEGGGSVNLVGASPLGGTWTGDGVSGGMFDPAVAGVGLFDLTYHYTDLNGCSDSATTSISVDTIPNVTTASWGQHCVDGGLVDLTVGAQPAGGTFSGPGVNGAMFSPSVAGAGTHAITYTYTDPSGCSGSYTRNIVVQALPTVSVSPIPASCQSDPLIVLSSYGQPFGGKFSGPGVPASGLVFVPASAGPGTHVLTYTYTTSAGCQASAAVQVEVYPSPSMSFPSLADVCLDASAFSLNGMANPTGGTYSGVGVTNNNFNPAIAGVGNHVITYTYTTNNGCSGTVTSSQRVRALPAVSLGSFNDVCKDAAPFALSGGSPAGGSYSGAGVVGGTFNPSYVSGTSSTITYTYTDIYGCSNTAQSSVGVNPLPTAPTISQSGHVLTANSNVPGATFQWWDANGPISGATANTITVNTPGTYYVEIIDVNGCTAVSNGFVVDFTSIMEALAESFDAELYPNPNNGQFEIEMFGAYGEEIEITITDALGKVVMTIDVPVTDPVHMTQSIDLGEMAKGVYFVNISTESKVLNKKVVVQ